MKKKARLASAKAWLPTYEGKNIVRGYRNWYGVDIPCAIMELEMLGVKIDPTHKTQLLTTVANQIEARAANKRRRKEFESESKWFDDPFQDGNFAYIAGYTPAGFPYGITWEELRKDDPVLYEERSGEPAYDRPAASVAPALDEGWHAGLDPDWYDCNDILPSEVERSAAARPEEANKHFNDVVEFFARGVTREDILASRPNDEISERVSHLLLLNQGDELLDIEAYELELLGHIEHFVQLVKARAKLNLANINQAPIR